MKNVVRIFLMLLLFVVTIGNVYADEKNLVNIYLFYSDDCPHCHEELEYLAEKESNNDFITVYKYEISDSDNVKLLDQVSALYDTPVTGVPFTIIGDKYFKGFSRKNYGDRFDAAIEYYANHGYRDRAGETIFKTEKLPSYPVIEDEQSVDDYIKEASERKISIFGYTISLKNMTLPIVSILIGLVDGFNPCAMWVLLFLIAMLTNINDKKRMLVIGLAFLLTSGFVYLLFMLAWLNAATLLLRVNIVRVIIGLVALIGAIINIRSYYIHRKESGCTVVNDKKRNKIFNQIKKFTQERNYFLAILGAMALAVSVNVVELACSAGLPVMFIEILSMNNPTIIEKIIYIGLYMLFFLIDDFIVFFIAVKTMEITGFSTKYGKISKLIGGVLLLIIGILLIFKPDWLMFNF